MKKLLIALAMLSFTGCEFSNSKGKCIGIIDAPVPGVQYEVSKRNVIISAVLFETVAVPAVVILTDYKCPAE